MNGRVRDLQTWSLAFVYGLAGWLMGSILASLAIKLALHLLGPGLLSAKVVQVLVLAFGALTGVAASTGYLRHR